MVASNFSLLHGVQTGYGANNLPIQFAPGPFTRGNMQERDTCSASSYWAGIENGGLISPFSHTLSWHADEWNTGRNDLKPYFNLKHI
jgi:hypothetical protein